MPISSGDVSFLYRRKLERGSHLPHIAQQVSGKVCLLEVGLPDSCHLLGWAWLVVTHIDPDCYWTFYYFCLLLVLLDFPALVVSNPMLL